MDRKSQVTVQNIEFPSKSGERGQSTAGTRKSSTVKPRPTRLSKMKSVSANKSMQSTRAKSASSHNQQNDDKVIGTRSPFCVLDRNFPSSSSEDKKLPKPKRRQRLTKEQLDWSDSSTKFNAIFTPQPFNPCLKRKSSDSLMRKIEDLMKTKVSSIETDIRTQVSTSQRLFDSYHHAAPKPKTFFGPEWKKPCDVESIATGPKPFIGVCPPRMFQEGGTRPPQVFTLTEDPRKKFCLVNPEMKKLKSLPKEKILAQISENVKVAQNINTPSISQTSVISDICEIIDLENPVQLDFQGLDYKNTYKMDEQDFVNKQEFLRILRYKNRRDVKDATIVMVEKDQQAERIRIPKMFDVNKKKQEVIAKETIRPISTISAGRQYGELYRSADKPRNKEKIAQENENRAKRYKDMYIEKQTRAEERRRKLEASKKTQFDCKLDESDDEVEKKDPREILQEHLKAERERHKPLVPEHLLPQTFRDAKYLREELKKTKRELRDRAKIREQFFKEKLDEDVSLEEAKLNISSDSFDQLSRSPLSTDDEDDLDVGKDGSCFRLRGYHFKLGSHLRGKYHIKDKRAPGEHREKGCMTRTEWLNELAPKREKIVLAQSMGVSKVYHPDDPNLELFPQKYGLDFKFVETAPIKEFRRKPLGRHYDRIMRKSLLTKRPRPRFQVKKFDLISFLYGEATKKFRADLSGGEESEHGVPLAGIYDYINGKKRRIKANRTLQRRRRMHFLGLPCLPKIIKPKATTACASSDSNDSDWIPNDPIDEDIENKKLPLSQRGNMPAPEFREPTIRQNPKRPRDYENLRVPSEIFDEVVHNSELPHIKKLPPDIIRPQNLRKVVRKDYTDMFEARRHHDHYDPLQHKTLNACYEIKKVPPEELAKRDQPVVKVQSIGKGKNKGKAFDKAYPQGKNWRDYDRTLPEVNIVAMIEERKRQQDELNALKGQKTDTREMKISKDIIYHSRTDEEREQEFPGRQEFLDFLQEIKEELKKREAEMTQETLVSDKKDDEMVINKEEYYRELEEDLKSIVSCLTSLNSSECTNFTFDSGSHLLVEKKTKIPLDYIRKPLVPFEELNRCRFEAVPIDAAREQANPFTILPFAGQGKEQTNMTGPKDKFYTFRARLGNGLRLRLEIKPVDSRKQLLGPLSKTATKAHGAVATDIDEPYVADLKRRPPSKPYKWNSNRSLIKAALRQKFESMLIQGEMVKQKIYDQKNEKYLQNMHRARDLIEKLFTKWEKQEYDASMAVVHKVKPYYELTDTLKNEYREAERGYTLLNMDIVYIENDLIRRTILQNFHYLVADLKWRQKHDWIHKKPNGELEGYGESIANRTTANIRKRERDDAWAIKEFYEKQLKLGHPVVIVFPTAKDFIQGIDNLKSKTFVLLLELHFTIWILAELHHKDTIFTEWCAVELKAKRIFAETKMAKKYFIEERARDLENRLHAILGEPIEKEFNDIEYNKMTAICGELYRHVVPENLRGSSDSNVSALEQSGMISEILIDLIGKFERIDVEERKTKELAFRRYRNYLQKQSEKAVRIENVLVQQMNVVRKNLAPPYKKPKRIGKLPRVVLKRKVVIPPKREHRISGRTLFFYNAFHDTEAPDPQTLARASLNIMENIQESIVPFYFDHFLTINGYFPNYNFKTKIELRDGPEIDRLKKRDIVPEVMKRMDQWEETKKTIMNYHISKHPEMYTNVQI